MTDDLNKLENGVTRFSQEIKKLARWHTHNLTHTTWQNPVESTILCRLFWLNPWHHSGMLHTVHKETYLTFQKYLVCLTEYPVPNQKQSPHLRPRLRLNVRSKQGKVQSPQSLFLLDERVPWPLRCTSPLLFSAFPLDRAASDGWEPASSSCRNSFTTLR